MDDITLTQLFARMDLHLEKQDAMLTILLQTLMKQNDVMTAMVGTLNASTEALLEMLRRQAQ